MPNSTIGGVSKAIEKGVLGVVGVPSVNQGGPSSSVEVSAPSNRVSPCSRLLGMTVRGTFSWLHYLMGKVNHGTTVCDE